MKGVGRFEFFSDIPVAMEKFFAAGSTLGWKLFNAFLVIFFAIFGITSGAISGAFIGLKTRTGILHGAIVGAIFGSVFSTCFFRACAACWDCEDLSSLLILSWVDSTAILATKLVHSYGTRMSESPAKGRQNKGLADEIDRIPIINLTDEQRVDSCSICLQELEVAQVARRLPGCQHMFHADCVDRWFSYQRSCPLCRHKRLFHCHVLVCCDCIAQWASTVSGNGFMNNEYDDDWDHNQVYSRGRGRGRGRGFRGRVREGYNGPQVDDHEHGEYYQEPPAQVRGFRGRGRGGYNGPQVDDHQDGGYYQEPPAKFRGFSGQGRGGHNGPQLDDNQQDDGYYQEPPAQGRGFLGRGRGRYNGARVDNQQDQDGGYYQEPPAQGRGSGRGRGMRGRGRGFRSNRPEQPEA